MKNLLYLIILLFPIFLSAQENQGIHFQHKMNWESIRKLAKETNRYIFVDCYTTWCGPCKKMSSGIFTQPEVGDYFNSKFINVKVQMDKTANDDSITKSWYNDVVMIEKEYQINAYPTFLYFSPEGTLVHRIVGGTNDAQEFISWSANAFDPQKQYYTRMKEEIKAAKGDEKKLMGLLHESIKNYDKGHTNLILSELMAIWKNNPTPEIVTFVDSITMSSDDYGFTFLLKNIASVNKIKGVNYTEKKLSSIVISEALTPFYKVFFQSKDSVALPDWQEISKNISSKYPSIATSINEVFECQKYLIISSRNFYWTSYEKEILAYVNSHLQTLEGHQKNSFAFAVFKYSMEQKHLHDAIKWVLAAIDEGNNDHQIQATYANLLYKTGQNEKAQLIMKKLVDETDIYQKKHYQTIKDKMDRGEPTWK